MRKKIELETETEYKTVILNLKMLRKNKGKYNYKELLDKLKTTNINYLYILKFPNKNILGVDTLVRIAKHYNLSIDQLVNSVLGVNDVRE